MDRPQWGYSKHANWLVLTEGIQNSEVGMADTKPCLALAMFRVIWLWDMFVDFEISIVPRLSRLD